MIEVKNLNFTKSGIHILHDMNLKFEDNKVTAIIGPNGAGKTTFFKCVIGYNQTYTGEIINDGVNLKKFKNKKNERIFGIMIEEPALVERKSALWNMNFYFDYYKNTKIKNKKEYILNVAARSNIITFMDKKVKDYSTGMKQKTSFATALMPNSEYLILDEPSNGMDIEAVEDIKCYIRELKESHKGIIITTHQYELLESLADYVYILREGKITGEFDTSVYNEERDYIIEAVGDKPINGIHIKNNYYIINRDDFKGTYKVITKSLYKVLYEVF